jgi:hypothetical protein
VKVVRKVRKIIKKAMKGSNVFLRKKLPIVTCKMGFHKEPSKISYLEEYEYDAIGICPKCYKNIIQTKYGNWVRY